MKLQPRLECILTEQSVDYVLNFDIFTWLLTIPGISFVDLSGSLL